MSRSICGRRARKALPRIAFDFIDGGADDEKARRDDQQRRQRIHAADADQLIGQVRAEERERNRPRDRHPQRDRRVDEARAAPVRCPPVRDEHHREHGVQDRRLLRTP